MRGQVCNLQLLLGLVSAVPLGSDSCGTLDHSLFSQFLGLPKPGGPSPHIYIPRDRETMAVAMEMSIGWSYPWKYICLSAA
jgi:hypothetical protein